MEQKIDFLIAEVARLRESSEVVASLVTKLGIMETKINEQQATITSLSTEVKKLKDQCNDMDQSTRLNAIRIFNIPGSNSETGLAAKVYEVIKPILVAAKANGDIPSVPQVGNAFSEVFRAGKFSPGPNKPPPPIIVKFASFPLRLGVLRNKRSHTPPPELGNKKIIIAEDLTPATHRMFRELLGDDRVGKIWTTGGTIWYMKKDSDTVFRVKSVFDNINTFLG